MLQWSDEKIFNEIAALIDALYVRYEERGSDNLLTEIKTARHVINVLERDVMLEKGGSKSE